MTIVSYSEVFKYQTCPRQYYYRFILNRAPLEESDAIQTGVKGHKLLQNFYELMAAGKTKEEALETITHNANKLLAGSATDFSLLKAWTLVDNYIRATDFTSDAIIIENRFLVPVRQLIGFNEADSYGLANVQIGFTPDVVMERTGGKLDVEDAKFVQRAWSNSKLNRFPQTKLYQIFLSRMGYDISRSLIRFFNVTTAKISTHPYILTAVEEQILLDDFIKGVSEVVKYKTAPEHSLASAPRTMNYTACQFCQFEFPCSLEAEGKDASRTLNSQYVESSYDYNR